MATFSIVRKRISDKVVSEPAFTGDYSRDVGMSTVRKGIRSMNEGMRAINLQSKLMEKQLDSLHERFEASATKMEERLEAMLTRMEVMLFSVQQPFSHQILQSISQSTPHLNPSIKVSNPNFTPFNSRVESDKRIRRSKKSEVAQKIDNLGDGDEDNDSDDEYHCNWCRSSCSCKRYHCNKLFDNDLCFDCFVNNRFEVGLVPLDFIFIEDNGWANKSVVVDEVNVNDVVSCGKNKDEVVVNGEDLLSFEAKVKSVEKNGDETSKVLVEMHKQEKEEKLMIEVSTIFALIPNHLPSVCGNVSKAFVPYLEPRLSFQRNVKRTEFEALKDVVGSDKIVLDGWPPPICENVAGAKLLATFAREVELEDPVENIDDESIEKRTSKVGSQIFTADSRGLRTLQVLWHPNSNSHVGILSTDSVLRLFDLSSDLEQAEQEYYLQPVEPGCGHNAASIFPVAFSFGDQHYWDRFSMFILFSDGSTYVLCPVIPFGSVFSWAFLEELREDVIAFGMKSSSENAIGSSNLALNWLESTFPELVDQSTVVGNKLLLKAHPYASVDASLVLQGPLGKAHSSNENKDFRIWNADCERKALSSLYISIGKDSVLLTAWSSGQLQIEALADEIQPHWNLGSSPRLQINCYGQIKGIAMICESKVQFSTNKSMSSSGTIYIGPPLLCLATVDLALPSYALTTCWLALYSDPLVSERFYCLHGGGLDSICLNFLPFSDLLSGTDHIGKEPSVVPVLTTSHGESCSSMALCGFVTIADTCGHTQLVGLTPSYECVAVDSSDVTEVASLHYNMDEEPLGSLENDSHEVINKDLLCGTKAIVVSSSETLRGLTADSIDGRKALHRYVNLFHENYVKYAHKVAVELEHHDKYLTVTIDDQLKRLCNANQFQLKAQEKIVWSLQMRKMFSSAESALIGGLAVNGQGKRALEVFSEMEMDGVLPNDVTFVGVLNACSHCGLVDDGWKYFNSMKEDYGLEPNVQHYCCLVDLYARAGLLNRVEGVIKKMPVKLNSAVWVYVGFGATI